MNDIMIDLETLGLCPGSPLLSIGAVWFNRYTGEIGTKWSKTLTLESQDLSRVEPETLQWWIRQNEPARERAFFGLDSVSLHQALGLLKEIISREDYVWGHGAAFDIAHLEYHYRSAKLSPPWSHKNIRDTRTLFELTEVDLRDISFEGIEHEPVYDSLHQIKGVVKAYRRLGPLPAY